MNLTTKITNMLRGARQRWGTSAMKRQLWNREFSAGRWDFIDNTADDVIYQYLEKYCQGGTFLDLGSGSGNTGCELSQSAYNHYTGVDISDVAIQRAGLRAATGGRNGKNRYVQADISKY